MSDAMKVRQPTKRPSTFDEHIPGSVSGRLKDKTQLVSLVEVRENVTCAGVGRIRVRFKATCPGVLKFIFLRSLTNHDTDYDTQQPLPVAVAANVEAVIDVEEHFGEGRAAVSFTPDVDGEVVYCDVVMS